MTAPSPIREAGTLHRNFRLERVVPLPELRMQLLEWKHEPTGAEIVHLANDDTENVFCLSFQTIPSTSNGVAHILEHTVLCGSEKYPVNDPFFSMIRRSLNTFMNAMTGADCTFYPAASQVPTDFYNLLDVYLDAVFRPKLERLSFLQEGHRLEYSASSDTTTPLEYKGIVYNEMKGAMASPNARLYELVNAHLYPDVTYGVNSGGSPPVIPTLTHDELCRFHRDYYHPSRCTFYFYGNLPTEKHLDFLADRLLDSTAAAPPLPPVPAQPRFTAPRAVTGKYPCEATETPHANTMVSLAWLTCPVTDQDTLLALVLLGVTLMDTDASPLKRALLDSKLCKQASLSIDGDNAEVPLYLTCKGCDVDHVAALEALVFDTLRHIAATGIDTAAFESALHQLELQRSEITGNGSPYGLSLFSRAILPRQHGAAPEHGLLIHTLCADLRRRRCEDPRYLEKLLERYLLDNPHRVCATLTPDPALISEENVREREALDARAAALTADAKEALVLQAQQLIAFQQAQEEQDASILPLLHLDEIPRQSRDYPLDIRADGSLQLFHHSCFTNQIAYVDYSLPLCHIAEAELPYFRLLISLYGQTGIGGRDFATTLDYIQAHTGGVGASTALYHHTRHLGILKPEISLHGKALYRNVDKLCGLLTEMAHGIDLTDGRRIKEIVLKQWSGLQSSFLQSAMRYASNLAASGLSVAGRMGYAWNGLEYYYTIQKLASAIDNALDPLIATLVDLQHRLLHGNDAHFIVSADADCVAQLQQNDYYGLAALPQYSYMPWSSHSYTLPDVPRQGRIISTPVASTCQLLRGIPYADADAAPLRVAAFLMDSLHLHPQIREQGGAYGGGASCNLMAGYFSFYSYRDPNLSATLRAFRDAAQQIADGDFDEEELFEAKLEMFQGMDSPVAPGSRADVAYTWWREAKPLALRQAFRDRVFALTRDDVAGAVTRHILPQLADSTVVTFASQELLTRENPLLDKPLSLLSV